MVLSVAGAHVHANAIIAVQRYSETGYTMIYVRCQDEPLALQTSDEEHTQFVHDWMESQG